MTTPENSNEAQIRERLESWANAVRAKDIEAVMSHYVPDTLLFDLAPPLKYSGANACQRNWASWFPTFQGRVGYEISELGIVACHDVAYCHSLNRIYGTKTDGERTEVWVRATVGFRNIDRKWMIAHEHYSVPFYMEPPYQASLDLKPGDI